MVLVSRTFRQSIRLFRQSKVCNLFEIQIRYQTKPPNAGYFKLNTDTGVDESIQPTCIGVVLRDSRGLIMASCAQGLDSLFSPPIAKALAILRCLNLAIETGLLPVCVESDVEVVVNYIISKFVPLSELSVVILNIIQFVGGLMWLLWLMFLERLIKMFIVL
ncbi:hypothetical protein ACOSP7_004259 [Xanthoceras sorbifolium]